MSFIGHSPWLTDDAWAFTNTQCRDVWTASLNPSPSQLGWSGWRNLAQPYQITQQLRCLQQPTTPANSADIPGRWAVSDVLHILLTNLHCTSWILLGHHGCAGDGSTPVESRYENLSWQQLGRQHRLASAACLRTPRYLLNYFGIVRGTGMTLNFGENERRDDGLCKPDMQGVYCCARKGVRGVPRFRAEASGHVRGTLEYPETHSRT